MLVCVVLAALAAAAALGPSHALWPLLVAGPFAAAFLWYDLRQAMRETQAELAGRLRLGDVRHRNPPF